MMKNCYIYAIKRIETGDAYVGSSVNPRGERQAATMRAYHAARRTAKP